jgi:NADH-quinone oxidoreductase subunit H
LFAAGGVLAIYHGLHPARRRDRLTLPVFGVVFLGLATLFLLPPLQQVLIPLFWFGAKVGLLLFVFIWVRGTLPRFRYDQLMGFAWKVLFPVALANLLITAFVVAWKG